MIAGNPKTGALFLTSHLSGWATVGPPFRNATTEGDTQMTGAQVLDELRNTLETNLESLPADAVSRARRARELEDRSLWSGRLRRVP